MHTHPNKLEYYSFMWSEIRLVIAALALLLGGVPPLVKLGLFSLSLTNNLLNLAWIISGLASVYMLYEYLSHRRIFATKKAHDLPAFLVSVVSGINLGLVPILNKNIGMSISSNRFVLIIVALIYLYVSYYLYNRWKQSGKRMF